MSGKDHVSDRTKEGLVSLGVGLAAAGVGAAVGIAADRVIGKNPPEQPDTENYGGLHIPGRVVIADDGTKLHVEIDELPAPSVGDDGAKPLRGKGVHLTSALDSTKPGRSASGKSAAEASGKSAKGAGKEAGKDKASKATKPGPDDEPLTLVFCHGYALSMDTWHFQRKAFRGRYRMVFWDQRGHGRSSEGLPGHSTIDQLGHDLADVIASAAPTGPLVLIGHSMGGMTVMSLAAHFPQTIAERVVAVAFVATSAGGLAENDLGLWRFGAVVQKMAPGTLRLLNRAPWLVKHARRLISDVETSMVRRYSYASPVSPALVKFTAAVIASTPLDVVADFLPTFATHDKRAALSEYVGMPSLVIVGDSDLMTPPSHSDEIAARLPEAVHTVVPQGGHIIMMEHPDAVTEGLEDLLQRVGQVRRSKPRSRRRGLLKGLSSALGLSDERSEAAG